MNAFTHKPLLAALAAVALAAAIPSAALAGGLPGKLGGKSITINPHAGIKWGGGAHHWGGSPHWQQSYVYCPQPPQRYCVYDVYYKYPCHCQGHHCDHGWVCFHSCQSLFSAHQYRDQLMHLGYEAKVEFRYVYR